MTTPTPQNFGALFGAAPPKARAEAMGDAGLAALARVPHAGAAVAGAFTDAVMMLRDAILAGDLRPAVVARFADALQRLRDVPDGWNVEDALLRAIESGHVVVYTAMRPVTLVLKRHPAFAEALALAERGDRAGISRLLAGGHLRAALTHPLLSVMLRKNVISGPELEFILTAARRYYLMSAAQPLDQAEQDFCEALAEQCFLNEYAFVCEDDERSAVQTLAQVRPLSSAQISILASYQPLSSYGVAEGDPRLRRQQVDEPAREEELARGMATLRPITDETSKVVGALYEENPYPRWVVPYRTTPRSNAEVFASRYPQADLSTLERITTPDILVAGCGTGQQLMMSVAGYRSCKVTAIDLSRRSLAFAARKVEELRVPNIRLMQADILDLDALDETFDIVEAFGVLHHMRDPVAGWRKLAGKIRPGGIMSVGLYSATARRGIDAVRAWTKARGFAPTHDGIVAFRQAVLAIMRDPRHPDRPVIDAAGLAASHDFYSVSTCRDLIFHPQERSFTIPEIAAIVRDLGLTFRGFSFPSPAFLDAYRKRFADDPLGLSLQNWALFEQENPTLFVRMYHLTLQKPR